MVLSRRLCRLRLGHRVLLHGRQPATKSDTAVPQRRRGPPAGRLRGWLMGRCPSRERHRRRRCHRFAVGSGDSVLGAGGSAARHLLDRGRMPAQLSYGGGRLSQDALPASQGRPRRPSLRCAFLPQRPAPCCWVRSGIERRLCPARKPNRGPRDLGNRLLRGLHPSPLRDLEPPPGPAGTLAPPRAWRRHLRERGVRARPEELRRRRRPGDTRSAGRRRPPDRKAASPVGRPGLGGGSVTVERPDEESARRSALLSR